MGWLNAGKNQIWLRDGRRLFPFKKCKSFDQQRRRRMGVPGRIQGVSTGMLKVCSLCKVKLRALKGKCWEVMERQHDGQGLVVRHRSHTLIFVKAAQQVWMRILGQVLWVRPFPGESWNRILQCLTVKRPPSENFTLDFRDDLIFLKKLPNHLSSHGLHFS